MILLGLLFSVSAGAASYQQVFDRLVYDNCEGDREHISESVAKEITTEVMEGKLKLEDFLAIWDKSCQPYSSQSAAKMIASGIYDRKTYHAVPNNCCEPSPGAFYGTNCIIFLGAGDIARDVKSGAYDGEVFADAWRSSCSTTFADQVARDVKKGRMNFALYKSLLFDRCARSEKPPGPGNPEITGRPYMAPEHAHEAAKLVAEREFDLTAFQGFWDKTCSFTEAVENAKLAKKYEGRAVDAPVDAPGGASAQ